MDAKTIAISALALSIIAIILAVATFAGTSGEDVIPLGIGKKPRPTTTTPRPTTTPTPTTTTIPNSCSDTDSGYNVNLKGTVSGYYSGYPYSYTDFCILSNTTSTMLNEYYCSGGRYYSGSYNCAGNTTTTCVDGACV